MTVLYWPVGTLYLAMPVGCALMLLFCIVDLIGAVRGTRSAAAGASPQR